MNTKQMIIKALTHPRAHMISTETRDRLLARLALLTDNCPVVRLSAIVTLDQGKEFLFVKRITARCARSVRMTQAWLYAHDCAESLGGSAREYFRTELRLAWADYKPCA